MPDPRKEVLKIVHDSPDIEKAGTCTRKQLDEVWAPLGWREAAPDDATPIATAEKTEVPEVLADETTFDQRQQARREAAGKSPKGAADGDGKDG